MNSKKSLLLICLFLGLISLLYTVMVLGFHPNTDQIYQTNWISFSAKNFLNFELKNNFIFYYLLGLYGNFTYFFMSTLFIILTPIALLFENFNFTHYSIFIYIVHIALIILLVNFYINSFNKNNELKSKNKYFFVFTLITFFYSSYHFFFYKISAGHHLLGTLFLYILIFYFNQQYQSKKMIIQSENYKFYLLYLLTIFSNYTNVFILFIFFIFYLIFEFYSKKKIIINKSRIIFLIINSIIIILTLILILTYNKFKPGQASFIISNYGSFSLNFTDNFLNLHFRNFLELIKLLVDGYGILIILSIFWLFIGKNNFILKILFFSFLFLFIFYPAFLVAYQRTIIYFIPLLILFSFYFLDSLLSKNIFINFLIYTFIFLNISWNSYPILSSDNSIRNQHFHNFSTGAIGNTIECIKKTNDTINGKNVLFLENNIKDVFTNLIKENDNFIPITSRLAYHRIKNDNVEQYLNFFDIDRNDINNINYFITRGNDINGVHKEDLSYNLAELKVFFEYFDLTLKEVKLIDTCHTNERNYDLIYLFKLKL